MSTRLELLKRYLQEDPSDSFLRYALALEFMALNKTEEAFQLLEKLLRDDTDYLAAYYMAGKMAEETGQISKAIYYYSKGIEVAKAQKDLHTLNELQAAFDQINENEE